MLFPYMSFAKIAEDAPPLSNGHSGALFSDPIFSICFWHCQNELRSAQTTLASLLTPPPPKKQCPFGRGKKVLLTIPPPRPLSALNARCPYGNNTFQKRASRFPNSLSAMSRPWQPKALNARYRRGFLPFCFRNILAPTKLGVQPVEFEVKFGCKGLHYLGLHSALKDKN